MNFKNKNKSFISAVVYVYNNSAGICSFLKEIEQVLMEHFEKTEVICVNDSSEDDSVEKIREYAAHSQTTITVLNMSYHQGLELSLDAGVDMAIGDYVFQFENAVLNFPLSVIKDAFDTAVEGYDVVAVCPQKNMRKSSNLFYWIYNHCSGTQYKLQTETFCIVSRRMINRVASMTKKISFRKAVYANCGLKKTNVYYDISTAQGKMSDRDKKQRSDYRNTAVDSLILYTDIAFKGSVFLSIFMMMVTILVAVYSVIIRIQGIPIEGWTSIILVLTFAFSGIFALLTMIIKYLSVILKLNFNRINYVIESIEKIK